MKQKRTWITARELRMVRRIAKSMWRRCRAVADDDRIGAGNLALAEADLRFDPARGVPFHAFASQKVTFGILKAAELEARAFREKRDTQTAFDAYSTFAARAAWEPAAGADVTAVIGAWDPDEAAILGTLLREDASLLQLAATFALGGAPVGAGAREPVETRRPPDPPDPDAATSPDPD